MPFRSRHIEVLLPATTPVSATVSLPVEANIGISVASSEPYETTAVTYTPVSATFTVAYESNVGVAATAVEPYEARETYANLILRETGLVSYWRLGEPSGNALDSKDSNPGTTFAGGVTRNVTGLLVGDS